MSGRAGSTARRGRLRPFVVAQMEALRAASEPPAHSALTPGTNEGDPDASMVDPSENDGLDANSESEVDEEELNMLRRRAERRRKKEEVIRLRMELTGEGPTTPRRDAGEQRLSKRPISSDFSLETPKHLRPAPPDTYHGTEGAKGLQSFLTVLELYFDAIPIPAEKHEVRVRHAASFLRDEAARSYIRERARITTWDDFITFLKGAIKDPASRLAAATLKIHNMRQRSGQSARQLLNEIEAAEQDIPSDISEEARQAWHFLNSLISPLRNSIMADIKEVVSRDQILAAAQRQEDLFHDRRETRERLGAKTVRGAGAGTARPSFSPQSSRPGHAEITETKKSFSFSQRGTQHMERKKSGACFVCGSMDHRSNFHSMEERKGEASGSQARPPGRASPPKK